MFYSTTTKTLPVGIHVLFSHCRFLLQLGGSNEEAVSLSDFQLALTWILASWIILETTAGGGSSSGGSYSGHEESAAGAALAAAAKWADSLVRSLKFPGVTPIYGHTEQTRPPVLTTEYKQVRIGEKIAPKMPTTRRIFGKCP